MARAAEAALRQNQFSESLRHIDNLLTDNPRTAFFYDVKFLQSQALSRNNPADLDGAIASLEEILQYADQPAIINRALCELGELLAKSDDAVRRQQAIARFHLVAMFSDLTVDDNRDYAERAIIGSARLLAESNEQEEIKSLLEKYQKDFPQGKHTAELLRLAR